jgi:hypothetical protein
MVICIQTELNNLLSVPVGTFRKYVEIIDVDIQKSILTHFTGLQLMATNYYSSHALRSMLSFLAGSANIVP